MRVKFVLGVRDYAHHRRNKGFRYLCIVVSQESLSDDFQTEIGMLWVTPEVCRQGPGFEVGSSHPVKPDVEGQIRQGRGMP